MTGRFCTRRGNFSRNGVGSPPSAACGMSGMARSPPASDWSSRRTLVSPTTTRERLIELASTSSFDGSFRRSALTASGRAGLSAAMRSGDRRSGSAKTTSKPITTAPISVSLSISRATSERGHGHCPTCSRLFSSMSTMAIGCLTDGRGCSRWKMSNPWLRMAETKSGSATRKASSARSSTSPARRAIATPIDPDRKKLMRKATPLPPLSSLIGGVIEAVNPPFHGGAKLTSSPR